jgi:hypothetical protein
MGYQAYEGQETLDYEKLFNLADEKMYLDKKRIKEKA